jgi:predicted house-cleaning noncanonical NTP pyrophosphatase (MazG superfamily)
MPAMSKVAKKRQPFKLQTMDLLLQIGVAAGLADEIASEVVKKSKKDTPNKIIRDMILERLKTHDAIAAKKLAKRFEYVEQRLLDVRREEVGPAGEIYDEEGVNELLEADEITAAELFFMEGREGRSWQRKEDHRDTGSTELAREDYYED